MFPQRETLDFLTRPRRALRDTGPDGLRSLSQKFFSNVGNPR